MAYTKTVWETGDVITAAKLNNAEDGIESHDPVIITGTYTDADCIFDITNKDLYDLIAAGKIVIAHYPANAGGNTPEGYGMVTLAEVSEEDAVYYYTIEDQYVKSYFGTQSDKGADDYYTQSFGME